MTNETYVECLVAHKPSALMKFLKILFIMLTAAFIFLGLLGYFVALIIGIVFGFLTYMISLNENIEYEYLYLDKEITIDKISGKTRRKRVANFEVDRMEILAPANSYHLDAYKNRQAKPVDYSSGIVGQPDTRYVLYYEGNQMIYIEPNEDFLKAVYNVAPRKVFRD